MNTIYARLRLVSLVVATLLLTVGSVLINNVAEAQSANLINNTTFIRSSNNFDVDTSVSKLWDGCTWVQWLHCSPGTDTADSFWVEFDLGKNHTLDVARLFGDADGTWVSTSWSLEYKESVNDPWKIAVNRKHSLFNGWSTADLNHTARYIKLTVYGDSARHRTQAREFEVYGVPVSPDDPPPPDDPPQPFSPTNLKDNATLLRHSDNFDPDTSIDKLWDGCTRVQWLHCSPGTDTSDSFWAEIDLGGLTTITTARLFGDADGTWVSTSWSLQYKEEANDAWKTAVNRQHALYNGWSTADLNHTARYIKLTVYGDSTRHRTQAREFEVYGVPADPSDPVPPPDDPVPPPDDPDDPVPPPDDPVPPPDDPVPPPDDPVPPPDDPKDPSFIFISAGVPKYLGEGRNYDQIFQALEEAYFSVFFPTFQYQEIPTGAGFGYESDFTPPCSSNDPAFVALRDHNLKLIVAADLIYPTDESSFPSLNNDPLQQIINCAGRANIYAVTNFDEPAHNSLPVSATKRVYERVKEVDSTIPVMLIHAPLFADSDGATQAERDAKLQQIKSHSQYAEIFGFDVYPVPEDIGKVTTPYMNGAQVNYTNAFPDYFKWLKTEIPGKEYTAVLQAFSYVDQYEPQYLKDNIPQEIIDTTRPPTREELSTMVTSVRDSGGSSIIWWGQSFLGEEDAALWDDITSVTSENAKPDTLSQEVNMNSMLASALDALIELLSVLKK